MIRGRKKKSQKSGCIRQLLNDREGAFSLRKLLAVILTVAVLTGYAAGIFFGKEVPEYLYRPLVELLQSILSEGSFTEGPPL